MYNSLVLKIMILTTIVIGLLCAVVPFITRGRRKLTGMMVAAFFYFISVIMLGVFYVQNGVISCTILELGAFSIKFHLEFLGVIFLGNLAALWCVTVYYSYHYLLEKRVKESEYCHTLSFMALCTVTATLMAMSANMMTMFVFYELLTLFTIPLVYQSPKLVAGKSTKIFAQKLQESFENLNNYLRPLLYSALLLWLPAILYIAYAQGSTDFIGSPLLKLHPLTGILLLLVCIFGIAKAALMPCHTWLPAAMVAPHPVSAMLHSVAVVNAGLFCIFKIMLYVFSLEYLNEIIGVFNWLIIIPSITIIYSSVRAIMCDDIKQLLAYSTISQLATCLVGAFLLSKAGIAAAVIHMLSHSASKITLFFAAGSFYIFARKTKISELDGIFYCMPFTTIIFCIASLSLMGAPLLAGYVSKAYLYEASADYHLAYAILAISTALTCCYMIKAMRKFFVKVKGVKKVNEKLGLLIPTSVCAIITMIFPVVAYVTEKLLGFLY